MKIPDTISGNTKKFRETIIALNANWVISVCTKATILLFLACIVAILIKWKGLPPQVPLWYAKPWGNERLADPIYLFLLPLGSIIGYIVNTTIGLYVTHEYLVFTQLLFITSLLVSLLSFLTLTKILLLVG